MKPNPINYLGIAKRSGKIIVGTEGVINSLPRKKLSLIIITEDTSATSKDKLDKKAYFYQVPVLHKYTAFELAKSLGVTTGIHVVGLTDKGITKAYLEAIERGDHDEG